MNELFSGVKFISVTYLVLPLLKNVTNRPTGIGVTLTDIGCHITPTLISLLHIAEGKEIAIRICT
jgi:hypothetical protein